VVELTIRHAEQNMAAPSYMEDSRWLGVLLVLEVWKRGRWDLIPLPGYWSSLRFIARL